MTTAKKETFLIETKGKLSNFLNSPTSIGSIEVGPNLYQINNEVRKGYVYYNIFQEGSVEMLVAVDSVLPDLHLRFNNKEDKEKLWLIVSFEFDSNHTQIELAQKVRNLQTPIAFSVFNSTVEFDVRHPAISREAISLLVTIDKRWILKQFGKEPMSNNESLMEMLFANDFALFDDLRPLHNLTPYVYQLVDIKDTKLCRPIQIEAALLAFIGSIFDYLSSKMQLRGADYQIKNHEFEQIFSLTDNILKNLTQPTPLMEKVADDCGIGVSKFKMLFKKINGESYYRFFLIKRLEHAKKLLKDTKMSINEISHEVGFQYPTNFIKTFKKEVGVSPAKYQRVGVLT